MASLDMELAGATMEVEMSDQPNTTPKTGKGSIRRADSDIVAGPGAPGVARSPMRLVMILMILVLMATVIGLAVKVANQSTTDAGSSSASTSAPPLSPEYASRVRSTMDTSVDPCVDFYEHACGGWRKTFMLNSSSYDLGFTPLGEQLKRDQLAILRSKFPFIGVFFETCSNTTAIDLKPAPGVLQGVRTAIESIASVSDVFQVLGMLHRNGLASDALLGATTMPIPPMNSRYLSVLGLDVKPTLTNLTKYDDTNMPILFGSVVGGALQEAYGVSESYAITMAIRLWTFERRLLIARGQSPHASAVPPTSLSAFNVTSVSELDVMTSLPLSVYLSSRSPTTAFDSIGLIQPVGTFGILTTALQSTVQEVHAYLLWHAIFDGDAHLHLPQALRDHISALHANPLYGMTRTPAYAEAAFKRNGVPPPVFSADAEVASISARDNACLQSTLHFFGNLLSHQWVVQDFPPENKVWAEELLQGVYAAAGDMLKNAGWLDNATRTAAVAKWAAMVQNVGYDSYWSEEVNLRLQGRAFEDYMAVSAHRDQEKFALYHTDVNRHKMGGRSAMDVNAYYSRANSINLKAGMMAPPWLDVKLPMMLSMAGYGMVIGHEIFHGFDDSGRQYGPLGQKEDWWTLAASQEYERRQQCFVHQYGNFSVVLDGQKAFVDGQLTLGENLADAGGISAAWKAYQAREVTHPTPRLMAERTNDQLFFVAEAQAWCAKLTKDGWRHQLATDVHSPHRFRVLGSMSNLPEFARTFSCSPSSPMGRSLTPERCSVW